MLAIRSVAIMFTATPTDRIGMARPGRVGRSFVDRTVPGWGDAEERLPTGPAPSALKEDAPWSEGHLGSSPVGGRLGQVAIGAAVAVPVVPKRVMGFGRTRPARGEA